MIRFLPDTWLDALLRPVAMAMPDGWVYVETMAPDLRFVFVLLLLILLLVALVARGTGRTKALKPMLVLLATCTAAFVIWLLTTGNGRYFIAFLLVVGPLCVAIVYRLPMTQGFRLTLALGLLGVQGFVVHESSPFDTWAWARWSDAPYFQVDVPPDMATQARSYVTMSTISYSLIAPLFPPASRWMNINDAPRDGQASIAGKKVQSFLADGGSQLTLLVPSIPLHATAEGLPDSEVISALNALLAEYSLRIKQPAACRFLRSKGALSVAKVNADNDAEAKAQKIGFWACPLRYSASEAVPKSQTGPNRFDRVFEKVEALCPRFFPPRGARTLQINNGELRHYKGTDMKVYVWNDGTVMYRYFRSYSPEMIGTVDDVVSGKATLDCDKLRGRSGLPWERSI